MVIIDNWWNVDFAKGACELRASTGDLCVEDPADAVREFETELRTYFASDSTCRGITLAAFGPSYRGATSAFKADTSKADWQLMLDFNVGKTSQGWTIVNRGRIASGDGDAQNIVHTVCGVVNQTGGSVAN